MSISAAKTLTWSVAVTTAPRKSPTLPRTIDSLRAAGWEPTVFAEPDSPECDAETVQNPRKLGVWHNWLQAVDHCLASGAGVVMTVQDDTLFHPDSKAWAEQALWPHPRCGFLSLYTPHHHSYRKRGRSLRKLPPGINVIFEKSLWGAMAMVWHPRVLRMLRSHPLVQSWLGRRSTMSEEEIAFKQANPSEIRNVDTAVGYVMRKLDRKMCYANPSPVQHISEYSSIGNRPAIGKRAASFVADHSKRLIDQVPIAERFEIQI